MPEALSLRQRLARWLAGPARAPARGVRMYANARPGRSGLGLGTSGSTSADAELSTSLQRLRASSRQMVRDSAYAKRARLIVVNNVIGSGIGFQAQVKSTRDQLRTPVNAAIEAAWCEWTEAENCHTGGTLHFHDLERAAMGQVFEAGECFIRLHLAALGDSPVPVALELIEPERLPDTMEQPGTPAPGNEVRMGVEVNEFQRPVAYWIRQRHPGDVRNSLQGSQRYERVPAENVLHLRVVDRWPQTRGEPWMHAVLRKIDDLNELSAAELQAVRASAYYFATIKTPESDNPLANADEDTGQGVMDIEPLTVQALPPGEELTFHTPNRPNPSLDAFMRHIVREMAAGTPVSYESLSRDYSQSNYSSSRLALLDDRDNWKALQQWWIRTFRQPLHCRWLQAAVMSGAIPQVPLAEYAAAPEKFEAVCWKPRGWSWIDPTKEVNAYKEAIKAGLTTLTDVIAATADGRDIEDVIATRKRELQMLDDADIDVDTTVEDPMELAAAKATPAAAAAPAADAGAAAEDTADGEDGAPAAPARVHTLRKTA